MLTIQDVQLLRRELRKDFATKEDFDRFATKEDLKNFATREDLKNFVTKKEFHKTTEKILELIQGVGNMIIKELGTKIDNISTILKDHEQRISKIEIKLSN